MVATINKVRENYLYIFLYLSRQVLFFKFIINVRLFRYSLLYSLYKCNTFACLIVYFALLFYNNDVHGVDTQVVN